MAGPDDPHSQEAADPALAARRAAVRERFLAEKPWTRTLSERHQVYLSLCQEDLLPDELAEFTVSLITGFQHTGRHGYHGSDKPPFDLCSDDSRVLVDAKIFDSGQSEPQHTLKVKAERPRKQFRMWSDEGEKAIPCQFAGGRNGWFLVPGIPCKDVRLTARVTAGLNKNNLLKPIRLLDKTDLSDWNDFEELERQWQRALAHLRRHEGAFMVRVRQEKEQFGEKEARETLVRDWERKIWARVVLDIPAGKEEMVELLSHDHEATQQVVERALEGKDSRRQIVEQVWDKEESKQQLVERVSHDREATQQIVERAMDDKESKQQIVERVSHDREATQQIVERASQDDSLMRGLLGDELFQQWKARQQALTATGLSPDKPLTPP